MCKQLLNMHHNEKSTLVFKIFLTEFVVVVLCVSLTLTTISSDVTDTFITMPIRLAMLMKTDTFCL